MSQHGKEYQLNDKYLARPLGFVKVERDNSQGVFIPKGPLDEEIIEDADTRHEQFTDEAERWHDDQ